MITTCSSVEPGTPSGATALPFAYPENLPALAAVGHWAEIVEPASKAPWEAVLLIYLKNRRWFGAKAREIKSLAIQDVIELPAETGKALITLLNVDYVEGVPELYLLPLAWAGACQAEAIERTVPHLAIARLQIVGQNQSGILYDAIGSHGFCRGLLELISYHRNVRGRTGELVASNTPALPKLLSGAPASLDVSLGKSEQSNSAVIYANRLMLKLFRRLEAGVNPDLEISRFLTNKNFPHIAPLAGVLEYRTDRDETITLAVLNEFIHGTKDGWEYTLDALGRYYVRVLSLQPSLSNPPRIEDSILSLAARELPQHVTEILGTYLESARLLGQRTAELHTVLASESENKELVPEPFTAHYQRSLYRSMRNHAQQNLQLLRRRLQDLPESASQTAQKVLASEDQILKRLRRVCEQPISTLRIRCHGDFHLGQVLSTGKDFVIIDFEGEPARSLAERRLKRSPLRDVAGMLRSFHYAAHAGLLRQIQRGSVSSAKLDTFQGWARFWQLWVSVGFLKAYLTAADNAPFLPKSALELKALLNAFLVEKALYELGYELNHRPDWVNIPLQGILQLLEPETRLIVSQ